MYIDFVSFYDFAIGIWNRSDSVVSQYLLHKGISGDQIRIYMFENNKKI